MENMRQEGRLSYMFRMVNLREKQSLDLSVISKCGNTFTDPVEFHEELTTHFSEWYRNYIYILLFFASCAAVGAQCMS